MAITKEQIFEAANAILEEGANPTLSSVRERLGGTGSFATITRYMQEWRNEQKAPAAPIRELAPEAITERVQQLSTDVWSIALKMANDRLKAEKEALDVARADMEAQVKESLDAADQLAGEVEQLRSELKASKEMTELLTASEQATRNLLQAETDENIRLKAELGGAEKRILDLRTMLEKEQQERQKNTARADDLLDQLGQEKMLVKDYELSLREKQGEIQNVRDLSERLLKERDEAKAALKNVEKVAQESQISAAKYQSEADALKKQIEQQERLFQTLAGTLKDQSKQQLQQKKTPPKA